MSRISSQQSASEHPSMQNIRNIIHRLKMPYLRSIDQAKYRFQEHVQQFKAHQEQSGTNPNNQQSTSKLVEQKRYSSQKQFRIAPQAQKTNTQLSCQQVPIKMKEPNLDEWMMGQNKTSLFHNMAEMNQHYTMMFDQKMKFCKASNAHNNSFIEQEKTVIERIYKQICNQSEQTVDFNRLASFFQQCPLYYTIYNIHPASLPKTIKDAAHYFEDRLTKTEFMNLFLINNRTNKDYENFNVQRKEKKCVLDEQKWEDIKEVFILFDTFGNQTVLLKQFMKKLQVSIQHKHLLEWDILSFESIGRTYKFGKILFELQDKLKISDSYFRWEQFQQMIMNFQHIREPTIDVIEKENIRAGKITNISNNFMLKTQVLDFIKEVFGRCPKYCQSFVKVSQFCNEIYQAQKSKLYLGEVVRTVPQIVTLKQVLKSLCADNYQYLDLDQIIVEFSLKIPIRNTYKSKPKMIECFERESENEQFESTLRQKQLNKKYSEKKLKKNSSKNLFKKENTIAHQFNLSKKTKQTIRQRKLNEMLQQKEKKQQQQYSKKFKAHPIPSSTNTQNYDQYKKKQAENKEQIKQKLKKVTERDTLLIKYLQTNTKLFQKRRKQESTCTQLQNYTFQHKPAPWFVHANLLDKIKAQKQQKSKHMLKQTNIKYLKQWKNLPFCAQSPASSLQILPQPNNYQDKNTKQIQLATTEDYSKRENKSKAKEVPNFQLLHKQFQQELNQKKTKIKPTQIMQFNLSSPKIKEKQIEQSASRLQKTVSQNSQNRKSRIEYRTNYIGSTLKYESMIRFNHQKKILQQLQQQEIEQKERRRQKSKKMFAKLLRKQLKRQAQSTRPINKRSRHTFQNHQNQKQLAQMYSRVFARPFLFQQSSQLRLKSSQKKAQRVKLQNKSSQMDKYLEQIQPHQIQYCAPNAQKVEIVSRQSI